MSKLIVTLFLATVICAQLGSALQCFICNGYAVKFRDNTYANNKNCPKANFSTESVKAMFTTKDLCHTVVISYGNMTITHRGPGGVSEAGKHAKLQVENMKYPNKTGTLETFQCDTDYCNSAGVSSFQLVLVLVPAILLRLLS